MPVIGVSPAVAAALAAAAALTLAAAARAPAAPPMLPLSIRVPVAPAAVPIDGLDRLVYELHVENGGDVAVTLARVEIRPDAPAVTLTIAGDELIGALDPPEPTAAPPVVPAGGRRVVYLDIGVTASVRGVTVPTRRVRHRIVALAEGREAVSDDGEGLAVDPAPPIVVGPPLTGGPWAAVHHPAWPRGHRRVFYTVDGVTRLPGRFTIDFVKLDAGGRTARGDADIVANALGDGAPVLAVADATVAAVRDDMPEPARVSARMKHAQADAAGNYVSLDLGNGRFAVYEHLKPRSVRVAIGQRVRRGEVIAALGFTGDSTGPHLHLHVADAARPLAGEGLPYVFERFDVLGRYPDIAAMGQSPWQREGVGRRDNERPAPNTVITFAPR
ncbi:MAG: M23 family metallopeptidase [Vicinamibacterales bacterium]